MTIISGKYFFSSVFGASKTNTLCNSDDVALKYNAVSLFGIQGDLNSVY